MAENEAQPDRRLYKEEDLPYVLQLDHKQITWLISTGQLVAIRICGEMRYDAAQVSALIQTYKQVAERINDAR